MKLKLLSMITLCLQFLTILPIHSNFIDTHNRLSGYYDNPNIVVVASTGRSGSTMLTDALKYVPSKYQVLKTHLLPPNKSFKGKILFIFSNPDQAAESFLHMWLKDQRFFEKSFVYVETADREWFKIVQNSLNQTLENNLLTYDALGCFAHLETWLHDRTSPSTPEEAQVLAIKYENLWDPETVKAIREFLNLSEFFLPLYVNRGTFEQFPQEILFKQANNLGTEEHPIYPAYDRARVLWENAPPFEYLKIID